MAKRTISENHLQRLQAQYEEAKTLKLTKVASSLGEQVQANTDNTRSDDAMYLYGSADLANDLNKVLWAAATRITDYLGRVPDARDVQDAIDKVAKDLFTELCTAASVPDGVGAHEPIIPGEDRTNIIFEVVSDE